MDVHKEVFYESGLEEVCEGIQNRPPQVGLLGRVSYFETLWAHYLSLKEFKFGASSVIRVTTRDNFI